MLERARTGCELVRALSGSEKEALRCHKFRRSEKVSSLREGKGIEWKKGSARYILYKAKLENAILIRTTILIARRIKNRFTPQKSRKETPMTSLINIDDRGFYTRTTHTIYIVRRNDQD